MTDPVMTSDDPAIPFLETEDPTPKPPPVGWQPVAGAEGLPDDVKNGDASPIDEAPDEPTVDKPV